MFYDNYTSMMDLNKIKFCNIVKLLMGHVQKKIIFSDILLIILLAHVTCQHITFILDL